MYISPSTFLESNFHRFVGLIAVILGSLACFYTGYRPWSLAATAEQWKEIPCSILSSGMKEYSNENGVSYAPDIRYSYEVDGKIYESRRVFLVSLGGNETTVKRFLGKYPVGSSASAFVNPNDHTEAVLDKHFRLSWLSLLISLVFLGFGGLLLFSEE